ncbi:MAG: RCC1 domain-containing protein [Planctomycetota bacterium]|jgi:hypothetical protein
MNCSSSFLSLPDPSVSTPLAMRPALRRLPRAVATVALAIGVSSAQGGDGFGVMVIGDRPNGVSPTSGVLEAAGGDGFAVARRLDGTLMAWGDSEFGQTSVPGGAFTRIALGSDHGVALRPDGTLAGWGRNHQGQASPPAGVHVRIASGGDHALAIRANGTLVAWGDGDDGMGSVPSGTYFEIACGDDHNVALRTTGTIVVWGSGDFGLGVPPAGTFTAIASAEHTSFGLRTDGTIAAWGSNEFNLIADVPSGSFVALAAGDHHVVARRADGSVAAWGRNTHGELELPAGEYDAIGAGDGFSLLLAEGIPSAPPSAGFVTSIYWRHVSAGLNGVWRMDGTAIAGVQMLPTVAPGSGWAFVGTGWFDHAPNDGDHTPEAVWVNGPTGAVALWKLEDDGSYEAEVIGSVGPGGVWALVAVANVDGDLDDDLVWQHELTGEIVVWIMNGDDVGGLVPLGQVSINSPWRLQLAADSNDDGTDDLFWWNVATGATGWWQLDSGGFASASLLPYVVGDASGWRVCGRGDFNDDFVPDLIWRNENTGANAAWLLDGSGMIGGTASLPAVSPTSPWQIVDGGF